MEQLFTCKRKIPEFTANNYYYLDVRLLTFSRKWRFRLIRYRYMTGPDKIYKADNAKSNLGVSMETNINPRTTANMVMNGTRSLKRMSLKL
ncbi:unnamed protein product [marine sediment metagenome]|uniref:Uncharacterized protein n=1 Tax=marine sediment metagenome TaxID=412755 RepID=X1DAR1_9ZZZZ